MNLVTGKLYWPETLPNPHRYAPLTEDITCDVAIVGGGEAGALCSHFLLKQDVDVVLLEKRKIAKGSSSANTGLLQFANDKSLTSCINSFGEKKGRRFYELCWQALDRLENISRELDDFPEFVRRDSLYFASKAEDVKDLRVEYESLMRAGFPVTYLTQAEVEQRFSFSKPGAIYATGDAQLNPYKLTNGTIADAVKKGMRVFEHTEVAVTKMDAGDLVLITKAGHRIRCKKAVFASGYETQSMRRNSNAMMSSSHAIVTNPVKAFLGWPKACLIWETARPYLYIRTSQDGRVIAGGLDDTERDLRKRDAAVFNKRDQLLAKIQALFPQLSLRAEYYWSATFCGTHDGLPLFGEQEGYPNCLFCLGYGGNGTVYATIGAQIVADRITKGSHSDADLFAFDRVKNPSIVNQNIIM